MNKTYWLSILLLVNSSIALAQFWKTTEPELIGSGINSPAEESTPFFSKDSSILYFTRTFDERNVGGEWDQDIWYSTLQNNGEYDEAQNLKKLNNKFNNAVVGISSDGNRIYLLDAYGGKKDLVKGLAVAERNDNGSWNNPKRVDIPNLQIDGDFYGFFVSPDEKVILISYNGPESVGEEDLYVSEFLNGNWTSPKHMGVNINSTGYEIAPFLNKTKDTLYFSSNGFGGLGDADIFYAVKTGSDWSSWSKPMNLGAPINSSKFDAYINISNDIIYWSSSRNSERSNIYKAKAVYYNFIGIIRDKETLEPIDGAHLIVKNLEDNENIIEELNSDQTGNLKGKRLPFHYKDSIHLKIYIEKEGYITKKLELEDILGEATEIDLSAKLNINLNKIEEGKTDLADIIDIAPIYFDLNSSFIRKDAAKELDKVVELMMENPRIVVELRSHSDSRGTKKYNLWLSDRRAKSSAEYIISQGISADRISGKGIGQEKPIYTDEEISKATSEKEKERMYEKNRRTEFIVVKMN